MRLDRALAWLLIAAMFGFVGCRTTQVQTSSVYDVLPGTWGWQHSKHAGCDSNPHVISFSEDRTEMILTTAHPEMTVHGMARTSRYRIYSDSPHLRMFLEGETRRDPATGALVLWDLVMKSPDKYCWHRSDWQPDACTESIVRCRTD